MTTENGKSLLKQASAYYRQGWSIIPIPHGKKESYIRWNKYQQIRPSQNQICQWFSNGKKNIAVVLGEVSGGLACRDFDTETEYWLWVDKYPELAKILPTVKTAKGYHVYFEGHIEGIKHIANGELRGSRCYCLLPPSLHPSGVEYKWVNPLFCSDLLPLDPNFAGLTNNGTEQTENTEQTKHTEHTEAIIGVDVEKIIKENLLEEFGTRNRKIFELSRALKSLPQFSDADVQDCRYIVREWHKRALPKIRTKDFAVTWLDFIKAWPRIKYPKGKEPMAMIFEKAVSLSPPEKVARLYPDCPKLQILASWCRELQNEAGKNSFPLSVRIVSKYLHIDKDTANGYLNLLVAEKVLRLVVKGGTRQNPRKASRYKFIAKS